MYYPDRIEGAVVEGRRPYLKPEIIHELDLETRAGTPNPEFINPGDPLGTHEDGF